MANFIGSRIKALREERKLSQDELARVFGFKDRQTVSAIETGERRVTAEELVVAVEKLGASLDYFTNPFLLVGEGRFPEAALRNNGRAEATVDAPPPFSKPFVEVIGLAIEGGHVSARRASGLLDLTVDELGGLFEVYGVSSPIEL